MSVDWSTTSTETRLAYFEGEVKRLMKELHLAGAVVLVRPSVDEDTMATMHYPPCDAHCRNPSACESSILGKASEYLAWAAQNPDDALDIPPRELAS
jgi:hypothetical protein